MEKRFFLVAARVQGARRTQRHFLPRTVNIVLQGDLVAKLILS